MHVFTEKTALSHINSICYDSIVTCSFTIIFVIKYYFYDVQLLGLSRHVLFNSD